MFQSLSLGNLDVATAVSGPHYTGADQPSPAEGTPIILVTFTDCTAALIGWETGNQKASGRQQ